MKSLDQQIDTLVRLGYPDMLSCDAPTFRESLMPLSAYIANGCPAKSDVAEGTVDFVLVIHATIALAENTLPLIERQGKPAIARLFPRRPEFFKPLDSLSDAIGDAYLLLDVDRGNETLNMVPVQAEERLATSGRTPLTMEEGVALLTQFPDQLQPNRCFMMLGSRGPDKRVPALWLSRKQPKLGWCWEGNPHTWLGFASARERSPSIRFARAD
ncbi:DUF5701 family protein [Massilia scottii]|uniref:DUF5701 family protein n=1 Tax=Massilia scottii TaxID=3057166 RepID=UPI002796904B|nr:DUF5701 family protein [Massilia sp. CCM 9029]MDQ1833808.1 DUF5701 family protein [Massilia sp. CCM 9029]